MKRIVTLLVIGVIAASALSAQAIGPRGGIGPGPAAVQNAEVVKVEGKLALVNGMIAVKDKDKTYYVGGIRRLVGFIDGLKENAAVKLEGYAVPVPAAPEYQFLRVTKLTFNGKDYDLSTMIGRMGGRFNGGCWGGEDQNGRGGMRGFGRR